MEAIQKIIETLIVKTGEKKINWRKSYSAKYADRSFICAFETFSVVVRELDEEYRIDFYDSYGELIYSDWASECLRTDLKALFIAAQRSALGADEFLAEVLTKLQTS